MPAGKTICEQPQRRLCMTRCFCIVGIVLPFGFTAAAQDRSYLAGQVFRDCEMCPEMVVLPDRRLALGC